MSNICDYHKCKQPICEEDKSYKDPHTKRYCEKHSAEITTLIEGENIGGMLGWWVRAGGGAEKMAGSF